MTSPTPPTSHDVWTRILSGQATDAEQAALQTAVDATPQLASQLKSDAGIHRLLNALGTIPPDDEGFVTAVISRCHATGPESDRDGDEPEVWFAAADTPSDAIENSDLATSDRSSEPVTGFARTELKVEDSAGDWSPATETRLHRPDTRRSPQATAILRTAAALALFAAGVVTGLSWRDDRQLPVANDGRSRTIADVDEVEPRSQVAQLNASATEGSALPQIDQPVSLASLRNVRDGLWATPRVENERLAAEPLRLLRGRGEIRFDDGAAVTLEGPADVRLVADRELALDRGRLTLLTPPGARAIHITTPTSGFIDRAGNDREARYFVAVDDSGSTRLDVLSGTIDVEPSLATAVRPERWSL
jgi:hypothetical protein